MRLHAPPVAAPQRAIHDAHPAVALVAVAPGFVMAMLDVTVVNVALGVLRERLHASFSSLVWVVDAYTLTFAVFLLVGGALVRRIGARHAYLSGLAWFIAASAACGLAPTVEFLVVARLVQGVGAALLVPSSLTLLIDAFPDEVTRTRVLGMWAAIVGLAVGIGSLVGGALVAAWGWRSLFYINVPFGTSGMLLTWYGLSSSAAGVRETYAHRPAIFPVLARNRVFWGNNLIGFLLSFVIFGDLFLVSLYLQAAHDSSPLRNGAEMLPLMSVIPIMNVVSRHLSARSGHVRMLLAGLSLAIAGCLAIACFGPVDTFWRIAVPVVCCNAGVGLAIPSMISGVMHDATPVQANLASTVLNASRQIGAFAGVAMVGIVLHGASRWDPSLRQDFLLFAACLVVALVCGCFLQRLRVPRTHDGRLTSAHFLRGNCS